MGRTRLVTILTVVALALFAVAWPFYEPARRATLTWQAERLLEPEESAALSRCEDPGWTGLSRVIEQDLPIDCPELWLARTAADHLGERERTWVKARLERLLGPSRRRLRYATALWLAGEPVVADWPFLVTDAAGAPGVRAEVVAAAVAGTLPEDILDPVLREDVDRARFLLGDLDGRDGVVRMLRRLATRPERASPEERARWSTEVLGALGFSGDRLEVMLDRRRRGLSWQGDPAMMRILVNRGDACADRASTACLSLAADLLVADRVAMTQGWDGGPGAEDSSPAVPSPSLRALILVLTGDPDAVAGTGGAFEATAQWIALGSEADRPRRLLGAVAWPGAPTGVEWIRAGLAGDPVDVLVARGGSPWAVALAATALGEAVAVPVSVHSAGEGVRIVAGDVDAYVGPCGDLSGLRAGRGAAWPVDAIVAQSALEAAGAALRAGRFAQAARLAAFAERLDPVGAKGAASSVAAVRGALSAEADLGRSAGAVVAAAPVPVPVGAEAERTARPAAWADLAAAWAAGADATACPAILGP